ncbi:MAG: electron transport complex subunit RsxC [Bacteroides sp.]|nr:electron transport complex subunit RsxC [Prevotella sp.]MCM1407724.1 electron transport complex subunit RsxC [Treponema brennaborense]MCM1469126.1 electron transport complex subunit RsxC [Bacteroides sp.]
MKTQTFKGGIHPPERKELSEARAIEHAFPSTKTVYIPVTMGGAPNQPVVKAGDTVARGQIIAQSDAFMSAPVHSSVAGTVKKIEVRTLTGNIEAPCIVIEADGSDRTDFMPPLDPFACSKEEALARVKQAGIVGMGGAAFPTHVKLNPPAGKVIEYVLANAAECEPYLTIDARTMEESAEKFIDGLAIAMKITGATKGVIAIEDNKKKLVPILQEAIGKSASGADIAICLCKTKYPQGGEKNLVQSVLKREIPAGGLPADIGCVIDNTGTLCAISEAFREGKPLIDRGLTVSGFCVETPKNLKVPVGTLVGDLIPEVVQLKPGVKKIISGGPMMGFAMPNANFPIAKNTSGVLFLSESETYLTDEDPCIGCGRCIDACSCRLNPVMIVRALKSGDIPQAKKYGLMDCVECGSCAFVCPARVRLVQRFRIGKAAVRAQMAAAKAKAEAEKAKAAGAESAQKGDK